MLRISKDITKKQYWSIKPVFSIELHIKDMLLLEKIQKFFGVGKIIIRNSTNKFSAIYSVQSVKEINSVIIPHFLNYSLLTQKQINFELFCRALNLINKKEHLNIEGIKKIVRIRASMNQGLTKDLKEYFPNIIPVKRPLKKNNEIKDPYWLTGFVDAEGCFYIKPVTIKSKIVRFSLVFFISQHSKDSLLMNQILDYMKCGLIEEPISRKETRYIIYRFSDHINNIIPFFTKYALLSSKRLDFRDFCKVSYLLKEKNILKEENILKIQLIKSNMNKNRNNFED